MAIVINYLYPASVAGGTTPPTFAQSLLCNTVTATIYATSGPDTAAVITHNFGLPAADISAGWPTVGIEAIDTLGQASGWWLQSIDPNWVGLGRLTSTATEDTVPSIKVKVRRPITMDR